MTIRSSDGVTFNLHRSLLEANTGAFPGTDLDADEEVDLEETSEVLEVLFEFVYPKRHPDLLEKESKLVLQLAEAVEKYEVFPAMLACCVRLRQVSRDLIDYNAVLY